MIPSRHSNFVVSRRKFGIVFLSTFLLLVLCCFYTDDLFQVNKQQRTGGVFLRRPRTAGEFLRRQFGEPHSVVNEELVYSVGGVIVRCSDKVLEESNLKLGSRVLERLARGWRGLLVPSKPNEIVTAPLSRATQNLKVRRDIRTLSKEEKKELRDAFLKLKNEGNPLTGVTYDTFNRLHDADDMMLYGHMAPSFLPWHRYFVYLMEVQLQNLTGNPNLTIPYWDFIEDSGLTSVFRPDFLGGNGIGNSSTPAAKVAEAHGVADINSPVLDGPFAYHKGQWNCSEGPLVPFLRRDFGYTEFSPSLPDKSQLRQCMNLKIYDVFPFDSHSDKNISFRACVEGWASAYGEPDFLHNRVHAYIGGNMREIRSSSTDPVFYLVHANVDRIFASWQRINGIDQYEPKYRIDRGYMALDEYLRLLSPPRTIRQLLNYEDLGYTYDRFIDLE
ncbi:Tyrosinase [Galdieria sulphuraria]|nr:Tyrosinase [Galdieria sulphuraria]